MSYVSRTVNLCQVIDVCQVIGGMSVNMCQSIVARQVIGQWDGQFL